MSFIVFCRMEIALISMDLCQTPQNFKFYVFSLIKPGSREILKQGGTVKEKVFLK